MGHLETGSAGLTIHKPPLSIDQILMKVVILMSKWSEALELAKAGFKAGEIREMWEEKDKDPEPKDPEPKDPEDDKYKELEKKYNELLKTTQQNNTKKDISDNDDQKTVEEKGYEILADMWR